MKWYGTLIIFALGFSLASLSLANATCSPTFFFVDGMNMTAAQINPGNVTGAVDASAIGEPPTGCDIGIYYDDGTLPGPVGGTVNQADVSGAKYFGVVANGGGGLAALTVNVTNTFVHNIGDPTLTGAQHGNTIFYINGSTNPTVDDSRTCSATGSTSGIVSDNVVYAYQKNGITVKCPGVSVAVSGNVVTGAGETPLIAQNGIELGEGALGTISDNTVSENEYTGTGGADSSGILVFGGAFFSAPLAIKEHITNNTLTDNDVGIFSVNCVDVLCTVPPSTPTSNIITSNSLSNRDISNVSGCGGAQGYQAGISDLGRNDQISKNTIFGAGYTRNAPVTCGSSTTAALFAIDNTGSASKVHRSNVVP
jgi:hypothetical protein